MTKPSEAAEQLDQDLTQAAMDNAIDALQSLATVLQLPVLMTILPASPEMTEELFQPVRVGPWCSTCKTHH